ncbi:MAG TPA: glycosyltransferase, partial [Casimicrobiaceae bacterium]
EFAAISQFIAERIVRHYGRASRVIYPPVDTDYFHPGGIVPPRDYYLAASRWVPYKRIDAIVAAFAQMPARRLIVAGDGPDTARIRAAARANVEFVGEVSRERLRELLRNARAFVFAAEEDFGILPLEAQACGTPVIAYARGGALETLADDGDWPVAAFFAIQAPEAIADAVRAFEARAPIDAARCVANAQRYCAPRFRREFSDFVGGRGITPALTAP